MGTYLIVPYIEPHFEAAKGDVLIIGTGRGLVILDLENYRPVADFQNPAALSIGVVHAFVNGEAAVENDELNGQLVGELIDRQNLSCPGS